MGGDEARVEEGVVGVGCGGCGSVVMVMWRWHTGGGGDVVVVMW